MAIVCLDALETSDQSVKLLVHVAEFESRRRSGSSSSLDRPIDGLYEVPLAKGLLHHFGIGL